MTDHATEREKTGAYALGLLADDERREFEAHLASCLECVREVRELVEAAAALGGSAGAHEPPAHLRAAILAKIGDRGTAGSGRGDAIRWWLVAASIALVASAGYGSLMRARVAKLGSELDAARVKLAATETTMAGLRRTAASADRLTVILASADITRVDLAGQAVAPLAGGRAFWSRSRGLIVTATNLPPAAADKVYQLWMVTAQAKISAGLFSPDDHGTAAVVVDSPSGVQPVAIAVTLEPAGGVPQPTGPMYLVGSL
jgi:anti-sigma-K factor RskA